LKYIILSVRKRSKFCRYIGKVVCANVTQKHKVRQECNRKASDELGERPNKIIMTEIAKQNTTVLLPGDVKSVRQALYRRLRKTQPKLPKYF
jgi:hypothetical protein